ncbi:MAG: c-type cytochrome biogenesis protein CcmI [Rhodobacteraceae bacterium]|nr:c-type cytochrome biogenesis protein CcmI [Paracoccaceae bacterium]
MLLFWIIAFAMALLVAALLTLAIVRGRSNASQGDLTAGYDLQVYREQLLEVERDLARGVISKPDAERVRVEVSRRILAADARVQEATPTPQTGGALGAVVVGLTVLVVAGTGVMYSMLGVPGYGDLGLKQRIETARITHETRPSQEQAEADVPPALPPELDQQYKALIDQLREKVAGQPDDLEGQILLAHHEAQSGNLKAARAAQTKVIALSGDLAGAEEYAQLSELMIVAANGYVSPQAEQALRTALEKDPTHGPARYYWGLMLVQTGRPDLAFQIWDRTIRQSPEGSPWLDPILAGIKEMAWLAGVVDYEVPVPRAAAPALGSALAGPSSEEINAAAGMSAEARQEMIQSMVARLSDRLATEGGSPDEWARLIGALGVLDQKDRAQEIYNEAKVNFAEDETALAMLGEAAGQAGLER